MLVVPLNLTKQTRETGRLDVRVLFKFVVCMLIYWCRYHCESSMNIQDDSLERQ